jgi:proton-translocating NADH-quinone oxidoreductase chain M
MFLIEEPKIVGLLIIPLIGILAIMLTSELELRRVRITALTTALIEFVYSMWFWVEFDNSTSTFQFVETFGWGVKKFGMESTASGISFQLGIDGISIFFVLLTTLLIPICILASWESIRKYVKEYMICFLLLDLMLVAVFTILDIVMFYIFFESVLIPMFLIIGVWGSRTRKIRAAYQFFLYTLIGSVLMLMAILLIYFETGTTNYQLLLTAEFSEKRQLLLWLAFFASFAVKVPMVPFHIWLPEAHVEAPTAGSVILAGILLKLGTYGLIRFSLPLFPIASAYYTPLVYTMSVIAVIYTSLTTLRQIDLKKIIAYSSVAHMGFVTIGLFTANIQGITGSIFIMLSHGLISSALFLCVGVLYDRYHTRILKYYNGIAQTMPIFAIIFLFFTLANLGFPGTSAFVGEILTLFGAFQSNVWVTILAATGMVLGAAYSIWLCNRILFGRLMSHLGPVETSVSVVNVDSNLGISKKIEVNKHFDMTKREFFVLLPLIFLTLYLGILPDVVLDTIHLCVSDINMLVT